MSVYVIAEVKLTDDSWIPDYAAKVHDIAAQHGGKYLSRSANITAYEGSAPDANVIALIEFPTKEAVEAFATSAEYAPFAAARQAGAATNLYVIDDTDATGGIPYLPAG